jgi:hypothetical protein
VVIPRHAIPTQSNVEKLVLREASLGRRNKTAVRRQADFDTGCTCDPTAKNTTPGGRQEPEELERSNILKLNIEPKGQGHGSYKQLCESRELIEAKDLKFVCTPSIAVMAVYP